VTRALALAALSVLTPLAPAATAAAADTTPPEIVLTVRGERGGDGWFTGPVFVGWTVSDPDSPTGWTTEGCVTGTLSDDTKGTVRSCRATSEGGETAKSTTIRIDATPPVVRGARTDRAADAGGWFNRPVTVTWSGEDATSGVASCTRAIYAGPDAAAAAPAGTCTDRAGNVSAPVRHALRYDATAPAVTGVSPSRPPAATGWFTAPVELVWSGADATSGVAACTTVHYAGPDREGGGPAGTCTDHAGNTAPPVAAEVRYDATPPRLGDVRARVRRGAAHVSWSTLAVQVRVSRAPGLGGRASSVLYRGDGHRLVDRRIRRGRRYVYTVLAVDRAGNGSRAEAAIGPRRTAWLVAPRPGARLTAPPVLRWRAVREARFYNVQLFRGRRKILSRWPARARLALTRTWRFGGRAQRLRPGRYRWYVWPGYGSRSAPRYGRLLGRRTFTVR
jgi:hypothetical protein